MLIEVGLDAAFHVLDLDAIESGNNYSQATEKIRRKKKGVTLM